MRAGIPKVSCALCGKVLSSESTLQKHMSAVHEKIRRFACQHCNHRASTPGKASAKMLFLNLVKSKKFCTVDNFFNFFHSYLIFLFFLFVKLILILHEVCACSPSVLRIPTDLDSDLTLFFL